MDPSDDPHRDVSVVADADLVLRTRSGDSDAFGELWRRHYRSGITVARSVTSTSDPDDLVQDAYTRIYQSIVTGGGPTGSFRAYLFTSIRNTAADWSRSYRDTAIEEVEDPETSEQATDEALDRSLTHRAFRSLPTRWQEVLWYSEIEQMTPAEIAPLLGMKTTAVAQLTFRAREGLREAWIQTHLNTVADGSPCQWAIDRLGAYARGTVGRRDLRKVEAHMVTCSRCTIVASETKDVSSRLALVLLPLAIGGGAATAYLATIQSGGAPIVALAAGAAGTPSTLTGTDATASATADSSTAAGSGTGGGAGSDAAAGSDGGAGVSGSGGSGVTVGTTGGAAASGVSGVLTGVGVLAAAAVLVVGGAVAAVLIPSAAPLTSEAESATAGNGAPLVVHPPVSQSPALPPLALPVTPPFAPQPPVDQPAPPSPRSPQPPLTITAPVSTAPTEGEEPAQPEQPAGPTQPAESTDPDPTNPGPTDPGPGDRGPTDSAEPTEPESTDPGPTDPSPVDPGPIDPGLTDLGPTDPDPTLRQTLQDIVTDADMHFRDVTDAESGPWSTSSLSDRVDLEALLRQLPG